MCILTTCRIEVEQEDQCSLEECLVELSAKIDENQVNYFNVNRRRLLEGAIRGVQRKRFTEAGRISVKFSDDIGQSEGAVDAGGPTREFFRLALECVINSSIFGGDESSKYLMKSESSIILFFSPYYIIFDCKICFFAIMAGCLI